MPASPRAFRVLALVLSVTVGVGAVEAYLRLRPVAPGTPPGGQPPMVATDGVLTYLPGSSTRFINEAGEAIAIDIDERGLRNPRGVGLSAVRVILLGDSFTAAVNTDERLTVAGRLRAAGLPTLNAGIDGIGTFTALAVFERVVGDHDGLTAVLLFYLGNDFRDNYWSAPLPSVPESGDRLRHAVAVAAGACSWLVACATVRDHFTVSPYAVDPMGSYALSEMQMLGPPTPGQTHAEALTGDAVSRLARAVERRGGRLVVAGIPSKAQVLRSFREISAFDRDSRAEAAARALMASGYSWDRPDETLAAIARTAGAQYLSMLRHFRDRQRDEPLYWSFDVHWNAAGQRVAAEVIAAALQEAGSAAQGRSTP